MPSDDIKWVDAPPEKKGKNPDPPQGFKWLDTPALAKGGPPAAQPQSLMETMSAPTQVQDSFTSTKDKELLARAGELGVDIGAALALPGALEYQAGDALLVAGVKIAARVGAMGLAGIGSGSVKEGIRRALGEKPDPNVTDTVLKHAGWNMVFEAGGQLVQKGVSSGYRWVRDAASGGQYSVRMTQQAAERASREELLDWSRSMGLKSTSAGRASESRILRAGERFGEHSLGGQLLRNLDNGMLGELKNAETQIMDGVTKAAMDQPVTGQITQNALSLAERLYNKAFGKAYATLDHMTADIPRLDIGKAGRGAIDEYMARTEEIREAGLGASVLDSPKGAAIRQQFAETAPGKTPLRPSGLVDVYGNSIPSIESQVKASKAGLLSWEGAHNLRSELLYRIRHASEDDKAIRPLLEKLATSIDGAMEKGAKDAGGDVYDFWRATDSKYKAWKERYTEGVLDRVLKTDASQITKLVPADHVEAMQDMYDAFHPPGVNAARAAQKWDAFRKGWLMQQMKGATEGSGQVAGETIATQVQRLDATITGDGKKMFEQFFSDSAGRTYVSNVRKLSRFLEQYGPTAASNTPEMYRMWYMTHGIVSMAAGAGGTYLGGPAAGAGAMLVPEVVPAALTAMLRSRTAIDLFTKGFAAAFPRGAAVGKYLAPSGVANMMRAVKMGMEEAEMISREGEDPEPTQMGWGHK